jgi:hypothetical protein
MFQPYMQGCQDDSEAERFLQALLLLLLVKDLYRNLMGSKHVSYKNLLSLLLIGNALHRLNHLASC